MNIRAQRIAGLETHIVGENAELAAIFCHGFGAPGTDLVALGQEFGNASPRLRGRLRCYFPEAPLRLDSYGMFGGRAWWMIDMEAIQRAAMLGGFVERDVNERPEGLLEARQALLAMIEQVKVETGLDESRIVLGGFSQGSMLTVDVATQLDHAVGGVIAWSGTLLNAREWRRGARFAGMKVVQSHGRDDPILSFDAAQSLCEFLTGLGWSVRWVPFIGPHTISPEGFRAAVELLEGIADA